MLIENSYTAAAYREMAKEAMGRAIRTTDERSKLKLLQAAGIFLDGARRIEKIENRAKFR